MLEGWLNYYGRGAAEIISAGTEPNEKTDLNAVRVMMDAVIDISAKQPKHIDTIEKKHFDYLFLFQDGLEEILPEGITFGEKKVLDLNDPTEATGEEKEILRAYGLVRDALEDIVFDFTNTNIKKLY